MQPMVNIALRAARNASQDLSQRLDRFDNHLSTEQEKAKFVADCAIGLEKGIIFELKKSFPEHNFQGRETGLNGDDAKQPTWLVCVIDEVANFRVGLPNYAILLACRVNNKIEHAVVVNPSNGDEFTASRGRGAQLNNRRIRCGGLTNLGDAIIGFTQPASSNDSAFDQNQRIVKLMGKTMEWRNIGSNTLSICYVAANRLQAALLSNVDEWSLNCASLIAAESGCLIADVQGRPVVNAPADMVVTNPRLLKALLA
ncbi:MAG: inositol monophosphatase family protein [Venatoribacter sp.]